MAKVPTRLMTAEEFFELDIPDGKAELPIEVISPSERPKRIREKVQDWFAGGALRVWLFYPRTRNVYVLRSPTGVQILGPDDTLSGEKVLPGFSCPVGALF
jgi:Uma2 family endonuclease